MPRRFPPYYGHILIAELVIHVGVGVLGWEYPMLAGLGWSTWVLVFCAGISGASVQWSAARSSLLALPIVLIPFVHGLLNFAFGAAKLPGYWIAAQETQAFSRFLMASAFSTVLGMLIAACGTFAARTVLRIHRSRDSAA